MSFRVSPRHLALPLAVLLSAALLSSCGGSSGAASTAAGSSSGGGATSVAAAIIVGDPLDVRLTPGGAALPGMADALIIGDHIVVRSRSDATMRSGDDLPHPKTRLSVLDQQGNPTASIDYGFTLAAGYTGEWLMLPSADGFMLLQAGGGSKLLHFDAQAKLVGAAQDLYPPPATGSADLSVGESGAAVDGNGFWMATSFSTLPVTDKTQFLLKLCKFDFNGKPLTPPFTISLSASQPRVAAANGAVLTGWMENSTPMVAMWAKGASAPTIRAIATGGAQPFPVALNTDGKMGLLWNGKATVSASGGVMGVALDGVGAPVLPAGRADLTLETLSANWSGTLRGVDVDARAYNGNLLLADIVQGALSASDVLGDVMVLADYGVGDGPLSQQSATVLRFKRPATATALGNSLVFRQMSFADHAVLLIGDDVHLEALRVTRSR